VEKIPNKTFLKKFLGLCAGLALTAGLISYAVNIFVLYQFNEYAEKINFEQKESFYEFFNNKIIITNQYFVLLGILLISFFITNCFFLAKKIINTISKVESKLDEISLLQKNCDFHQIELLNIEHQDFFKPLIEKCNKAIINAQALNQESSEEITSDSSTVLPFKKAS
jgi:hypothetical protein